MDWFVNVVANEWLEAGGEVRAMGRGREGLGSRAVGHVNGRSGARAGDNSTVVGEVEEIVGGGRGD